VDLALVLQLLAVLPPVVLLPLMRRSRRRKRVRYVQEDMFSMHLLILYTEKEESDEDMGFGLFD